MVVPPLTDVLPDRQYPLCYPPPAPLVKKKRVKVWRPKGPFPLFKLPSEIRNLIYEFALLVPRTIDLSPENRKDVAPGLALFQTCRRVHEEAYPIFYGYSTFRLFPTNPQFFQTKKALLTRLPRKYRNAITSVELRLGPGWSKPPKVWNMGPKLGLSDCTSLRQLKIFVEVDPSHDIFKGFRVDDRFYTLFCSNLLEELMDQVPSIRDIEFEAWPSVRRDSSLMQELFGLADAAEKRVTWAGNWDVTRVEEEQMPWEAMAHLSLLDTRAQVAV